MVNDAYAKPKSDKYSNISPRIESVLTQLSSLSEMNLDQEDIEYIQQISKTLDRMKNKYDEKVKQIEAESSRMEKVSVVIKKSSSKHNRGVTDNQKKLSAFNDNTSELKSQILDLIRESRALGTYNPDIPKTRIHVNSNEAAIIKLVQLIRTKNVSSIDKFIAFMDWYADNMDVAESVIIYAALVFCNAKNVAKPKSCYSNNYDLVIKGIKNQAWDLTYITQWSTLYHKETNDKKFIFATDDTTQKFIVANILPIGHCCQNVYSAFETKSSHKKLNRIFEEKLGKSRVRPFKNKSMDENLNIVKELISRELSVLKTMLE